MFLCCFPTHLPDRFPMLLILFVVLPTILIFIFSKIFFPSHLCLSCSLFSEFLLVYCTLLVPKYSSRSFSFPPSRSRCSYLCRILIHQHAYVIAPGSTSPKLCFPFYIFGTKCEFEIQFVRRKKFLWIYPPLHIEQGTGKISLSFSCFIAQLSSSIAKQLYSCSNQATALPWLDCYTPSTKYNTLCERLGGVDVLSFCKSLRFTEKAEHSKLNCELWGQRFLPLAWYSRFDKFVLVIKRRRYES